MYGYRVIVKHSNLEDGTSHSVLLSQDMIQGIYSLYQVACAYYMYPRPNAEVINHIVTNFRKLEIRRTEYRDPSVPILSRIAYDTQLFRLSDIMFTTTKSFVPTSELPLPYHIVGRFDSNYVPEDMEENSFHLSGDDETCRYYLGFSSTGRNTFLIKVIAWSNNISEFIRGFALGLKWYSEALGYPIPDVYLYDYEKPVSIPSSRSSDEMNSFLPKVISIVKIET